MMKEKERKDGEVYIEITSDEHAKLNENIGKVKAFLEIMYGCLAGPTGTEEALTVVNKNEGP